MVYNRGFWLEVVTLVIPGWNDSADELRAAAEFIASVSPFIPWHVSAFRKDYHMTDPDDTGPETLRRAARIGEARGAQVRLRGEPARTRGAVRAHLVPPLWGLAGRTVRLLHPAEPPRAGRPLPRVRHGHPGYLAVS